MAGCPARPALRLRRVGPSTCTFCPYPCSVCSTAVPAPAQAPAPAPAAKALGPVAAHPMELTRRHCGHGIGPSLAAAAASSDGRAQWMQAQAGKVREGTYRTLQGCLTELCEYLLHSTACPEPWDWIHARLPRGEEVLHRSSSLPRWSGEVPRSPTAQPSLEVQVRVPHPTAARQTQPCSASQPASPAPPMPTSQAGSFGPPVLRHNHPSSSLSLTLTLRFPLPFSSSPFIHRLSSCAPPYPSRHCLVPISRPIWL